MSDKGDLVRENILKQFRNLIIQYGYKNTTLKRLSQASGVSLGNISFYFKKKEYLLLPQLENFDKALQVLINKLQVIPDDDPILHFTVTVLLRYYISSKYEMSYHAISDLNCDVGFLEIESQHNFDLLKSALESSGVPFNYDDLFLNCINSAMGLYVMGNYWYTRSLPLDYAKVFRHMIISVFFEIDFPQLDYYIQKTFDVFDKIDKAVFIEKFMMIARKYEGGSTVDLFID